MKKTLLVLSIGLLGLASCQKEKIQPNPTPQVPSVEASEIKLQSQSDPNTMGGFLHFSMVQYTNAFTGEQITETFPNFLNPIQVDSIDWNSSFYITTSNGMQQSIGWTFVPATFTLYKDNVVIDSRIVNNEAYVYNN